MNQDDARPPLPPGSATLPAAFYLDPGQFEAEFERFYVHRWVCVGRTESLAGPGDFLCPEIGDQRPILLRDDGGVLRAFHNTCRHRGTRLCDEPAGRLRGTLQCPYHAWTYALDGRLLGAPHMDDAPGFRCQDYPLAAAGVADWEGHLFVFLGEDPPDLHAALAPLAQRFAPWGMAQLREARRVTYDVRANWKLLIHNYSECLHCPMNHPALQKLSHYLSGVNVPPSERWLGGAMDLREGVDTLTPDGRTRRPFLPGLDPEARRRVHYYAVLPNLLLSLHPDYLMTHWLFPRAVDRTEVVCAWHFHPEALARADFDPDDAVAFWDITNREDWRLSELTQLGLASRGFRPGPYSNREDLLLAFDRIIRGETPRA
jgi:Rieske 2Fe-2S family protein